MGHLFICIIEVRIEKKEIKFELYASINGEKNERVREKQLCV